MKNKVRAILPACILGLGILSGCANTLPPSPMALPCPVASSVPPVLSQDQTTIDNKDQETIQTLHKRLQERERTIATRDHQIEVLSSQSDALKLIDQDTRNQRRSVPPSMVITP